MRTAQACARAAGGRAAPTGAPPCEPRPGAQGAGGACCDRSGCQRAHAHAAHAHVQPGRRRGGRVALVRAAAADRLVHRRRRTRPGAPPRALRVCSLFCAVQAGLLRAAHVPECLIRNANARPVAHVLPWVCLGSSPVAAGRVQQQAHALAPGADSADASGGRAQVRRWAAERSGWAIVGMSLGCSKFGAAPTGGSTITRFLQPRAGGPASPAARGQVPGASPPSAGASAAAAAARAGRGVCAADARDSARQAPGEALWAGPPGGPAGDGSGPAAEPAGRDADDGASVATDPASAARRPPGDDAAVPAAACAEREVHGAASAGAERDSPGGSGPAPLAAAGPLRESDPSSRDDGPALPPDRARAAARDPGSWPTPADPLCCAHPGSVRARAAAAEGLSVPDGARCGQQPCAAPPGAAATSDAGAAQGRAPVAGNAPAPSSGGERAEHGRPASEATRAEQRSPQSGPMPRGGLPYNEQARRALPVRAGVRA